MIALNFFEVFTSLQIAVFGYTLVEILMGPGQIFDWHKRRLEVFECGGNYFKLPGPCDNFDYTIVPWRSKIAKPLGGCVLCTTGQIALWFYFISHFKLVFTYSNNLSKVPSWLYNGVHFDLSDIHPVRLFLFVALTIFTTKVIDKCLSNSK